MTATPAQITAAVGAGTTLGALPARLNLSPGDVHGRAALLRTVGRMRAAGTLTIRKPKETTE